MLILNYSLDYLTIAPKWENNDVDNLDIVPLSGEKKKKVMLQLLSENP